MSHPATAVQCPTCAARPGSPCRRPSDHELPFGQVHAGRRDRAIERGIIPPQHTRRMFDRESGQGRLF